MELESKIEERTEHTTSNERNKDTSSTPSPEETDQTDVDKRRKSQQNLSNTRLSNIPMENNNNSSYIRGLGGALRKWDNLKKKYENQHHHPRDREQHQGEADHVTQNYNQTDGETTSGRHQYGDTATVLSGTLFSGGTTKLESETLMSNLIAQSNRRLDRKITLMQDKKGRTRMLVREKRKRSTMFLDDNSKIVGEGKNFEDSDAEQMQVSEDEKDEINRISSPRAVKNR